MVGQKYTEIFKKHPIEENAILNFDLSFNNGDQPSSLNYFFLLLEFNSTRD